jgi:uroporphyrin-3 C-methyltransferase
MTENKASNELKIEEKIVMPKKTLPQTDTPASPKNKKSAKLAIFIALLSLVLLFVALVLGGYFYQKDQKLNAQQQLQINHLGDQLSAQVTKQHKQAEYGQQLQSNFKIEMEQINSQLQQVQNENKLYKTDIQALQRTLAEARVRHPNDWVLAEVEYLVSLAGRKIWLERDIPTAIALLLTADKRIVELSDSSLSVLRSMLLDDINMLEALPKRDPDGLVIALSSLERRIDKLVVLGGETAQAAEKKATGISTDINDWQENLAKSWSDFVNGFIVINKRETQLQALLSPQQRWYLKEKLRNDLAKAEFSIYREQQDIYDIALHSATDLLKNYFDLTDNTTSHFYKTIQELGQRKISINYPDQLKTAPLLDRIIQQRVQKSLAASSAE